MQSTCNMITLFRNPVYAYEYNNFYAEQWGYMCAYKSIELN